MQIVIPMSGFGERFRKRGYTVPKPLIFIDGRSIISYVVDLFPGENDIFFICNERHLSDPQFKMRAHLKEICPQGKVLSIPPHKLGPIHAINQIKSELDPCAPTLVNYCDFSCYWDWNNFKKIVNDPEIYGAIPAYRGFHPHSLGSTNYAYMKESHLRLEDIQEKEPFTKNRIKEFASSGTYYFKTAELMCAAFDWVVKNDININNEFYVSVAYKYLLKNNLSTLVYPLQHFMQWGTPEDVDEYIEWSQVFKKIPEFSNNSTNPDKSNLIVPMAGLGKRFKDEGYKKTKPLINVSGQAMVTTAIKSLPNAKNKMFVLRDDIDGIAEIKEELSKNFPGSFFHSLSELSEGQAITVNQGLKDLKKQLKHQINEPITVAACDNAILYNNDKYEALINEGDFDILVWGGKNHVNAKRQPKMFGWIDYNKKNMRIKNISVKNPIDQSLSQPIVIGMFTFKNAKILEQCIEELVKKNHRINNEFYLDSAVNEALNLGLSCKVFNVDHFISFGTPSDLKTFEYWQSCFSKWNAHPYQLEKDPFIPANRVCELKKIYGNFNESNL